MLHQPSRRTLLKPGSLAVAATGSGPFALAAGSPPLDEPAALGDGFPAQPAALVRTMVTVAL